MSRKQIKRKKKITRIVLFVIFSAAIITVAVLYFYPRTLLYLQTREKLREIGTVERFEILGEYFGESEWMDTDWLSVQVPLEYGVIDEAEITEDELGTYYTGSGINLFVSSEGVIQEDDEKDDGSLDIIWANTKHEYELALYKASYKMPSIFMPIAEFNRQADEYIAFTTVFANKRYCYYEYSGYGCTILNTEDEKASVYTVNIYDLNNNLDLIGQITLSYDKGASRDVATEDRGVGLVIISRVYYGE